MKQIKPKVVGYEQILYRGLSLNSYHSIVFTKEQLIEMSKSDYRRTRIKSKFRPVYAKSLS